jgi:hypothetical protein
MSRPVVSATGDPDAGVWQALADQHRARHRAALIAGASDPVVRRIRVDDPRLPYARTMFSLELRPAERTVQLYLVGTDRTVGAVCRQDQATSAFVNADSDNGAAGFTVSRSSDGNSFTLACDGAKATVDRPARVRIIAFLLS